MGSRRWLATALVEVVRDRSGKVLGYGELTKVLEKLQDAVRAEDLKGLKSECRDAKNSGCSIAIVVVTPTRSLRGAWIGDCGCFLGVRTTKPSGSSSSGVVALGAPHGSTPVGSTKLTRTIGMLASEGTVSNEADEFMEADLDSMKGAEFLLIRTGGLWRGIDRATAASTVSKAGAYHAQF